MKISEIQAKDKKPFRAYFNRVPIWWKYHERTQAIFDYANERYYQLPTKRLAYDDLIRGLVKEGLFDKLDLHYIFSGDGDINFKLLNIINPGTYNGIAFGGLEWSNEGVKGNGVNGYVDTNFNPALLVEGQKYQLNDAIRGALLYNAPSASIIDSCWISGGVYNDMAVNSASSTTHRINQGGQSLNSPVRDYAVPGFRFLIRDGVGSVKFILDENLDERTTTGSSITSGNQCILSRATTTFGTAGVSCYLMGSSLTFEQTQTVRQILNNYLTAIGLEPIA